MKKIVFTALRGALYAVLLNNSQPTLGLAVVKETRPTPLDIINALTHFGLSKRSYDLTNKCQVIYDLNKDKILGAMSDLSKIKLLPAEIEQSMIEKYPMTGVYGFATGVATLFIREIFDKNPVINHCQFAAVVEIKNIYGQLESYPLFKFEFDRSTYEKINWDQFEVVNIEKLMKNLQVGKYVSDVLGVEISRKVGK